MIRNRRGTWRSSISSTDEMLPSSAVIVFLAIASCVAGAPIQLLEGENIGLGQAIYSQPELTAALARTYDALESDGKYGESEISRRNLDHIGGGNLLRDLDDNGDVSILWKERENKNEEEAVENESKERNLDHIGGGNLLRDLNYPRFIENSKVAREQEGANEAPSVDDDDDDTTAGRKNSVRRREASDDSTEFERNLDRIGGGNLLRDLNSEKTFGKWRRIGGREGERTVHHLGGGGGGSIGSPGLADGFKDDPSKWPANRGTLDSLGGGNSVRRRDTDSFTGKYELSERNLDHIGGGNLLRHLHSPRFIVSSRVVRDEQQQRGDETTERHGLAHGFKDDPSKWPANRGTLDSLGGGNSVRRRDTGSFTGKYELFERNLDHIGGGNLLRNLDWQRFSGGGGGGGGRGVRSGEPAFTVQSQNHEYRTTLKPDLLDGFKDDPSKWDPNRGTLDHIGGGNLLGR